MPNIITTVQSYRIRNDPSFCPDEALLNQPEEKPTGVGIGFDADDRVSLIVRGHVVFRARPDGAS